MENTMKAKNKRWYVSLMILLFVALVACQSSVEEPAEQEQPAEVVEEAVEETVVEEEAPEPVTIEFWHTPGSGRPAGVAAVIEEFESLYPHLSVDTKEVPFPEFISSFQVAYAGDTPPDVALANGIEIQNLAFNGALLPLDDIFDEEDLADFMPDLVDMVSLNGVKYGVPWE